MERVSRFEAGRRKKDFAGKELNLAENPADIFSGRSKKQKGKELRTVNSDSCFLPD